MTVVGYKIYRTFRNTKDYVSYLRRLQKIDSYLIISDFLLLTVFVTSYVFNFQGFIIYILATCAAIRLALGIFKLSRSTVQFFQNTKYDIVVASSLFYRNRDHVNLIQ